MNFYDIYITLQHNPDATKSIEAICENCKCMNRLEDLKAALQKKPSRVESPGAFGFDEETGKIYDALWKAADAENYSTAEKVGRWLMKLICPPADDEGMKAYHKKYHDAPLDDAAENAPTPSPSLSSPSTNMSEIKRDASDVQESMGPNGENDKWEIEDEDVVVLNPANQNKSNELSHRSKTSKKAD